MTKTTLPMATLQRRFLPSYAILRSFECAAKHESFTKAAQELHLTQSAISRQVKELEEIIGTNLFLRTGKRVILSEAGKNLAHDLSQDLENIRQTVLRAVTAGENYSSLRVAVLPTLASRWLIPRLPEFTKKHPNVIINLVTRLKPFDMVKERIDVAIHFGDNDWPNTKMEHLFKEEVIAVCSPKFQKMHKIINSSSLENAPLLHLESRPNSWQDWFDKNKIANQKLKSGARYDQFSMLIHGALASLGAALLPKYLIETELSQGSLISLGKTSLKTNSDYFIVSTLGITDPNVVNFSNWIKSITKQ